MLTSIFFSFSSFTLFLLSSLSGLFHIWASFSLNYLHFGLGFLGIYIGQSICIDGFFFLFWLCYWVSSRFGTGDQRWGCLLLFFFSFVTGDQQHLHTVYITVRMVR